MRRVAAIGILLALWGPPAFRSADDVSTGQLVRGGVDAAAKFQLGVTAILVGLVLVLFAVSVVRGHVAVPRLCLRRSGLAYILYVALALLSVTYSSLPLYTAYKAIQLATVILLVCWYVADPQSPWYAGIRLLVLFYVIVTAYNVGAFAMGVESVLSSSGRLVGGGVFAPDYGTAGLVTYLGGLSLILFGGRTRSTMLGVLLAGLGGYTAYLSGTRSIILPGFVFSLLLLVLLTIRQSRRWLVLAIFVGFTTAVAVGWTELFDVLLRRGEGLATLSGRTVIWQRYADYWRDAPLFGHGYAAASRLVALETGTKTTAHSDIWQVLVSLGGVGLLCVISIVGFLVVNASALLFNLNRLSNWVDMRYAVVATGLSMTLVAGIFSGNNFTGDFPSIIATTAMVVLAVERARFTEKDGKQARRQHEFWTSEPSSA